MPEPDLLEPFVAPLAVTGIAYLVTGSIAATLYGEPRATFGWRRSGKGAATST